jgi:hypothetical protein
MTDKVDNSNPKYNDYAKVSSVDITDSSDKQQQHLRLIRKCQNVKYDDVEISKKPDRTWQSTIAPFTKGST